ncbi:hypothetical protein [Alloyangia pacifica]|uniref:hypothetical protein n=1 Tax=Alloyangia pacifica TaxID=311180 RepID=UPI001CFDB2BD|nr:hypothetical protein [Alloyangia pacifica]
MCDLPPGIYLHLGLHRTGTGAFQQFLAANLPRLGDCGLHAAFSNRDGAGGETLRLRLPPPRHFGTEEMRRHGRQLARRLRRAGLNRHPAVLISEENLIGGLNAVISKRPYPAAGPRLAFLRAHLDAPVRRVVLVLRSYEAQAISVYRKRLEFRALQPFEDYARDIWPAPRGWPELVADIRAALEPEEILLLRHEDRPSRTALLRALCPEMPETGWREPDAPVNFSAGDAACFALLAAHRDGQKLSRDEVAAIIRHHARAIPPRPLIDLPEETLEAQRARYRADLERLRAMQGVTLR